MSGIITFQNDNNTNIILINHPLSNHFKTRPNKEKGFRAISSYLLNKNYINGNIIDLGSWVGDNSIPWAKQIKHTVYAIDPCPKNIEYIELMSKENNISNIKTIQKAVTDKNRILHTIYDIHHCTFNDEGVGEQTAEAVSLDYLLDENIIENISYIHLDVESYEFKVIRGSISLIKKFNPTIAFEQHVKTDNYKELSQYLYDMNYDIYIIDEILPGCRQDCRNFFAFPLSKNINVKNINESLGELLKPILIHDH